MRELVRSVAEKVVRIPLNQWPRAPYNYLLVETPKGNIGIAYKLNTTDANYKADTWAWFWLVKKMLPSWSAHEPDRYGLVEASLKLGYQVYEFDTLKELLEFVLQEISK